MWTSMYVQRLRGPILIVAAHPDDDILGCGGFIQRALKLGKKVFVVFLTNGDANEDSIRSYMHQPITSTAFRELGFTRYREAIRAQRLLGLSRQNLFFLGFPDGLLYSISTDRQNKRIHRSSHTRLIRASYPFSYQKDISYTRHHILKALTQLVQRTKPQTVIVHSPADIHSDHIAAWLLMHRVMRSFKEQPAMYTYLVHYLGWPKARGLLRPPNEVNLKGITSLQLNDIEEFRTRMAYGAHRSQALLSDNCYRLIRQNELFWKI